MGKFGRVAMDMDIHGYIHGYIHVWISDIQGGPKKPHTILLSITLLSISLLNI